MQTSLAGRVTILPFYSLKYGVAVRGWTFNLTLPTQHRAQNKKLRFPSRLRRRSVRG